MDGRRLGIAKGIGIYFVGASPKITEKKCSLEQAAEHIRIKRQCWNAEDNALADRWLFAMQQEQDLAEQEKRKAEKAKRVAEEKRQDRFWAFKKLPGVQRARVEAGLLPAMSAESIEKIIQALIAVRREGRGGRPDQDGEEAPDSGTINT